MKKTGCYATQRENRILMAIGGTIGALIMGGAVALMRLFLIY